MKKSKVYSINDEEFINLVNNSYSFSECLRKLGLYAKGGSSVDVLKRRIMELNISIEHFCSHTGNLSNFHIKPLKEILVKHSTYVNTHALKKRLLKENLLDYKCAICGNVGEWNGQKLVLQLDHINGNNTDNRLENLRLLCPNCHSQTDTFCSKNRIKDKNKYSKICENCSKEFVTRYENQKFCSNECRCLASRKVKNRPTREELKLLLKTNNYCEVARMFGVSDNAVRKWLKF